MINIKREISIMLLALKLAKQAEKNIIKGSDSFEMFRTFAKIIKNHEEKEKKNE